MVKESLRKCSHCGHNGHNSRTCNVGKEIKLFGVNINVSEDDYAQKEDESIRKSKSMGNLEACNYEYDVPDADGYLSDGLIHESSQAKTAHERRKGKPWSEEEHRSFLFGLEKLGKGDWKGISKNFVHSRTPTQVASHAQKYFIRMTATERKKRRSSVFDIPLNQRASTSKPSPASTSHKSKTPISPQVKTFERPPLSPRATTHVISDLLRPQHMIDVRNYGQGIPGSTTTPNVSFLPMWSFSNQKFAGFPAVASKYTCAPSVARQSSGICSLLPSYIPPRPGPANETATKDGLDLSVQALTL